MESGYHKARRLAVPWAARLLLQPFYNIPKGCKNNLLKLTSRQISVYYSMSKSNIHPFWKRIQVLVKAHKVSQKYFADYVGINYSSYKSWLYHSRLPDAITTYKIATALGVSMEFLVTGKETRNEILHIRQTEARKKTCEKLKKLTQVMQKEVMKL